jgi:hypothetical protein
METNRDRMRWTTDDRAITHANTGTSHNHGLRRDSAMATGTMTMLRISRRKKHPSGSGFARLRRQTS